MQDTDHRIGDYCSHLIGQKHAGFIMTTTDHDRRQQRRDELAARLNGVRGSRRQFDYDPTLLVNDVLREVEDGVHDIHQAMGTSGLSMGYPSWNLLYYTALCSLSRPSPVVVEVGTNRGYSTSVLAQALADGGRGGVVHTIDIDPEGQEVARTTVERAGHRDRVRFHTGDSVEQLGKLAAEVASVDFVLLDGAHEYEKVVDEFAVVHPLTTERTIVYFDNTGSEGVADALVDIRANYAGNLIEFPNCSWWPPGNALWQRDAAHDR
jgi:predicted O-methyltransferase YrrM